MIAGARHRHLAVLPHPGLLRRRSALQAGMVIPGALLAGIGGRYLYGGFNDD